MGGIGQWVINSLTTIGYLLGVFFRLWIPFLDPYFDFCLELALETWAKASLTQSLWVHDPNHTHSLANFQWSGLFDQRALHLTECWLQACSGLESGPLVVLLLFRITTVQACLVAVMLLEDQHWTHVGKLFVPLQWKLRPCINRSVNKSLCQVLESSPVVLLFMSPHLLFCQP